MTWKKGRGKLGPFAPLLGVWHTEADTEMGRLRCTRSLESILDGKYLELRVIWTFATSQYEERALIGVDADKTVRFWSFTSDGKRSEGSLADVTDLHPDAVGFEAQMPAGLARQAYWPHDGGGFVWVVEAQTKKGWRRMVEHHYTAV